EFFKAVPRVRDVLALLHRVGLDYIHVGQQATTLSGGEAQRVKLAKELSKRATGRALYILDEPTTGLHFHAVAKLLELRHELADQGNTVVVIEHNLQVIKTADWIIDLGPEGGDGGGEIVAQGTPEDVVKVKRSYTGQFLTPVLGRKMVRRKKGIEAGEERERRRRAGRTSAASPRGWPRGPSLRPRAAAPLALHHAIALLQQALALAVLALSFFLVLRTCFSGHDVLRRVVEGEIYPTRCSDRRRRFSRPRGPSRSPTRVR